MLQCSKDFFACRCGNPLDKCCGDERAFRLLGRGRRLIERRVSSKSREECFSQARFEWVDSALAGVVGDAVERLGKAKWGRQSKVSVGLPIVPCFLF